MYVCKKFLTVNPHNFSKVRQLIIAQIIAMKLILQTLFDPPYKVVPDPAAGSGFPVPVNFFYPLRKFLISENAYKKTQRVNMVDARPGRLQRKFMPEQSVKTISQKGI